MRPTTLRDLATWSGGALLQGTPSEQFDVLSTDTRTLGDGDVFLALVGDRFDGHDFLADAIERGVGALVVSRFPEATESFPGAIIHVRNTLDALQDLAFSYRRSLTDLFAIGVTGSNGKTSTKDFLRATLSAVGEVSATEGNLNNHIGLPLTILRTGENDRHGVWEMGMNHAGEIEVLAEMAGPDAAVLTNIGTAHIENLRTRDAIAEEKCELALAVPAQGFCVMPVEDDYHHWVAERVSCEMVSVGIGQGDLAAVDVDIESDGCPSFGISAGEGAPHRVTLPVSGRHMVTNALLAAAVGVRRGVEIGQIAEKLSNAELTGGRLQPRSAGGLHFLDDSYNANPDSMRAAIAALSDLPCKGRRIAVLGAMGELGEHEESGHREVGEAVARAKLGLLITVGETAGTIGRAAAPAVETVAVESHEEAAEILQKTADDSDLILVKGSRAAQMENVIAALQK